MIRRLSWLVCLAVLVALLPAAAGTTASGAPAPGEVVTGAVAPAQAPAARRAGRYTPKPGVLINNPVGTVAQRNVIFDHLVRSIRSTPKRGRITIATWNFRSNEIMRALINAHQRGVSVRLVMARSNANPASPNKHYNQLRAALKVGNKKRPKRMKSWAAVCRSSCRGTRGIAHTKMFVFDRVGKANNVVIFGSNNATDTAARWQWNDVFTMVGRPKVYEAMRKVINEMRRDKRARPPYVELPMKKRTLMVYPYLGKKAVGDPIMRELEKVSCRGARGGTGVNGRTAIRIAQTAMTYDRGKRLATKLRQLWEQGCDIKIIYAMFGNNVLGILRDPSGRGPVPNRRIATDWNGDGYYDRYLHTKVMTISGHHGNNRQAEITWNGSANFTTTAMVSDEVVMRLTVPRVRRRYSTWIDRLYSNPPPERQVHYRTVGGERVRIEPPKVDDPYKYVEIH